MSILDPKPPRPPVRAGKHVLIGVVACVIVVAIYFGARKLPEERAVAHFLEALQQGRYQDAYRLWQPSPTYSFQDFLHDWGEQGDYGKVREFRILRTRRQGRGMVIVTVRINGVDPPLDIAVDRKTQGLAYSLF